MIDDDQKKRVGAKIERCLNDLYELGCEASCIMATFQNSEGEYEIAQLKLGNPLLTKSLLEFVYGETIENQEVESA